MPATTRRRLSTTARRLLLAGLLSLVLVAATMALTGLALNITVPGQPPPTSTVQLRQPAYTPIPAGFPADADKPATSATPAAASD